MAVKLSVAQCATVMSSTQSLAAQWDDTYPYSQCHRDSRHSTFGRRWNLILCADATRLAG
jgi:hypothetical protein